MRPQELVNLELPFRLMVFIGYPVLNHEHLESRKLVSKALGSKK